MLVSPGFTATDIRKERSGGDGLDQQQNIKTHPSRSPRPAMLADDIYRGAVKNAKKLDGASNLIGRSPFAPRRNCFRLFERWNLAQTFQASSRKR